MEAAGLRKGNNQYMTERKTGEADLHCWQSLYTILPTDHDGDSLLALHHQTLQCLSNRLKVFRTWRQNRFWKMVRREHTITPIPRSTNRRNPPSFSTLPTQLFRSIVLSPPQRIKNSRKRSLSPRRIRPRPAAGSSDALFPEIRIQVEGHGGSGPRSGLVGERRFRGSVESLEAFDFFRGVWEIGGAEC